ncbi:TPA: hypothetical protein HA265_06050 [Candidatus Woesearchaeota archaeon]|nr:hypothetical protein [Candidatus Woesearchaeota archaeon]
MKRTQLWTIISLVIALLLLQTVSAMSASEAKQDWLAAKQVSSEKQAQHREAKADFAADKSEGNRQKVVDTGKAVLDAALDEADAWLTWKDLEAEENPLVPEDIKQAIFDDVETNRAKIDALRDDVDAVKNQVELGLTWLKMVGKYFELLSDVMRNSGAMWVHVAQDRADTIGDFEQKLRAGTSDPEVLSELDQAKAELKTAEDNIARAGESYKQVKIPGTPLIKFHEGNLNLQLAKTNMLAAHMHLNLAYAAMVR